MPASVFWCVFLGRGLGTAGLLHHALRLTSRCNLSDDFWTLRVLENPRLSQIGVVAPDEPRVLHCGPEGWRDVCTGQISVSCTCSGGWCWSAMAATPGGDMASYTQRRLQDVELAAKGVEFSAKQTAVGLPGHPRDSSR